MKQTVLTVAGNRAVAENTFRMRLNGDVSAVTAPGQFINIKIEGGFLRRPISVCSRSGSGLTIYYKTVGRGTEWLSTLSEGAELDVLTGLGNGFDLSLSGERPLLLGGGIGIAPLYDLAKGLRRRGKDVQVVMGFRRSDEVILEDAFAALGCAVTVATEDGSHGVRGFVTDALPDDYDYFFACGPGPMLRAVYRAAKTSGQFSLEERMGCGFGACMGCSIETKSGAKRVCRDGPVFRKEELPWDD